MENVDGFAIETTVLFLLVSSRGATSRRKILTALLSGPKNCNQISKETKLNWWAIQRHLQHLHHEKLVKIHNFGQIKIYANTPKGTVALKVCITTKNAT
ncbi:MAG: winged helix-turn-helix domain-containing protein [Nitrososphaerota archaeon]|nr:winged helix-turn-helix domain-containing protein [Nitrososphaerota archaeon]